MSDSFTDRLVEAAKRKGIEKAREKAREKFLQSQKMQTALRNMDAANLTLKNIQAGNTESIVKDAMLKSRHVQQAMAAKQSIQQRAQSIQRIAQSKNKEEAMQNIAAALPLSQENQENIEGKIKMGHEAAQIIAGKNLIRNTLKLALQLRKAAAEHDPTAFFLVLILAIIKDASDIFTFGFSAAITWSISVILAIFLWGKGTVLFKIVLLILSLLEVIPALNMLPVQSMLVLFAWYKSETKANADKKKAEEYEKQAQKTEKELKKRLKKHRKFKNEAMAA
ncbi:hypothetical protein HY620_02260 [Candidatus Uhrbacteria bacterium]|nr:hypothetical protein [Candidatus Uhrbacteria bacterium]